MHCTISKKRTLTAFILALMVGSMFIGVLPVEAVVTTITVNSTIVLTKSFDGGGKIYKHGPYLGDYPIFRLIGTGITLSNVVIDDSNFIGTYSPCVVSGDRNSIKYCTLRNCLRYGFTTLSATNFYIGYNTIESAQYGISGSGGTSKFGVIEHNNIRGVTNCGFKIKNMQNVVVRYNYVDLAPRYVGRHPIGVNFSDDRPNANLNVVITDNDFVRASKGLSGYTYGVTMDSGCYLKGNKVVNNRFSNTVYYGIDSRMFGVVINGDYFQITENRFVYCVGAIGSYPVSLMSGASYNVIKPNVVIT
jgi:hypothetical protein